MKRFLWIGLVVVCVAGNVFADNTFDYNPKTGRLDLVLDNSNAGVITGSTVTWTGLAGCNTVGANGGALTTDAVGNVRCSDDDTGAGGGDPILVNGSAVGDAAGANFADSTTIAWTLTTSLSPDQVSGIVVADSIGENQLADADFGDWTCADGAGCLVDGNAIALTTDTTGNYVEDLTCSETISGCVAAGEDTNQLVGVRGASLTASHLNSLDAAADEEFLTYEAGTGQFEWQTGGGGGNSFETWDTPTGTDIVADTTTDTAIFTASGIIVTGTAASDTVDFTLDVQYSELTGDVTATNTGVTTIQPNAAALATDTTGNFVATIADAGNVNITVTGSGSENAAVTLDVVDVTCTGCLSATELGADSVSSDELNATGVEAELESTLDIAGDVSSTGMASTVIGANTVDLTTETVGNYVQDLTCNDTISGCVAAAEDANPAVGVAGASLTRVHLNSLDLPADEEFLTYEGGTGQFEWQAAAGGGNSFETWDAPMGDDIVAESSTDTAIFTASGIVVSGTAASDTLDFTLDVQYSELTGDVLATNAGVTTIQANAVALTTDTTGNYVQDLTCNATISGCVVAAEDANQEIGVAGASLTRVHLNSLDAPADEEFLTYEGGTGQFEWQAGGGGGDSITVNSSAATDPDFADGDIDWTLTGGNSITATVGCPSCVALTTESSGNYVEDLTCSETMSGCVAAAEDSNQLVGVKGASLTYAHLNSKDAPANNEHLAFDSGTGRFQWQTATPRSYWIPCIALIPIVADDSVPPLSKDAGTTIDQLNCTFDATTDEARTGTFVVPSNINTSGNTTVRFYWYSSVNADGSTDEVVWDFKQTAGTADGVDPDSALTSRSVTATTSTTAGQIDIASPTAFNETNWAANDLVYIVINRDADNAADDLEVDAILIGVSIEVPTL